MRFSWSWLKQHVDIEDTPEALDHRLTMAGLPVEQIERPAAIPGTVVVGKILAARQHPNADRLRVCTVEVGGDEPLSIVCGAPNARDGLDVVVAQVGSTLPNGLKIKKAKLRGEPSQGMICSEIELGVGEDADGIIELVNPPAVGTPYATLLGERDVSLEIDVPSNRGDCLCHVGMAREIAALTGRPLSLPALEPTDGGEPIDSVFSVSVAEPGDCMRFTAHLIRGIRVGPSPDWLVRRLESVGQRSINNIVDITNFVMLEWGQPMHAFDLAKIGSGRILIRRARPGETLVTLDGIDRKLNPEVLVVTDGAQPIALGGIMGGANTEVDGNTTDVLLEAAWFRSERILRGSRDLRMDTDASLRFRRGIDPENTARAAHRAALLMAELGGGTVAPGRIDEGDPEARRMAPVALRPQRVGEVIGDPVPEDEIADHLASFGFAVERRQTPWVVSVPSWRRDVFEECDLIEEVARHRGYDRIGTRQFNYSAVSAAVQPDEEHRRKVRHLMHGMGFHEAITRVLTAADSAHQVGLSAERVNPAGLRVLEPPSAEEEILRTTLAPALLDAVSHNLRHGVPAVRLYELGKTFRADTGRTEHGCELPEETTWVALAAAGGDLPPSLEKAGLGLDYGRFRGFAEELAVSFRIDALRWRSYTGDELVPPGSLELLGGDRSLGFAWEAPRTVLERWDVTRPLYFAQIRLDALVATGGPPARYQDISRFPAVRRDLALVVPEAVTQAQVRATLARTGGEHLRELELFDYYRGKHIPGGHVGLGFRLTFRAPDRTLKESEIDKVVETILAALRKQEITLRDS